MGQPKGKTGNPNGRPKGTVNPVIAEIREDIRNHISSGQIINRMFIRLETIEDDYKYVQTVMNILDIVLPRLASEQLETGEVERSAMSIFDKVSEMIKNAESKPPDPTTPKLKAS